jgi:branched-chain amino acid transport system substrate-binding protein
MPMPRRTRTPSSCARAPAAAAVVALAAALLLGACSAGKFRYTLCAETAECRAAFGRGWVCGESGLCEEDPGNPRCEPYPPGLLDDLDREDDILFGAIVDRSAGGFELLVRAAKLAVDQVNGRQGLDSRRYSLMTCSNEANPDFDDLDDLAAVGSVGAWMADVMGVAGVMGPVTSSQAEAAYNALAPRDTLIISPSATSPALTALDGLEATEEDPGLLWRTPPPDDLQGRVVAGEMKEVLGVVNVAVVYEVGAYGTGLKQVFLEQFVDGTHDGSEFPFTSSAELASAVAEVAAGGFDEVLVISSVTSDSSDFLIAAAAIAEYADIGIFMTDGAFATQMLDDARDGGAEALFPNVRGTVPRFFNEDSVIYNSFRSAYLLAWGGEDPRDFGFTAHAYDATWMLVYGSAWASYQEDGVITGTNMARGLRHISSGDLVEVGPGDWNNATARFEAGQSFNLEGASGRLDYDPVTEETTAPIDVWTINAAGNGFVLEDYCWDVSSDPIPECTGPPGG